MNLSEHFTLQELSQSEIALRTGLDNTPNAPDVGNLTRLCEMLLEPARSLLGVPLHINSGFRSGLVNAAIGGARNSAHMDGRAADFVPVGFPLREAFDVLRTSKLPFDQIIFECAAWIHIAIAPDDMPRKEALTAMGHPGAWHYERVA
jgi:zinc D-Ala-D-Ala carboxypeptidase